MKYINKCYELMRHIFSMKKTKVTLYIAAVLWLAVTTQIVMNKVLEEDLQITQAFVKTNSGDLKSSIEIIAEYKGDFLSEDDKKNFIQQLADSIGLTIDGDILVNRKGIRSEYSYGKQAKRANTLLKIVSLEQEDNNAVKVSHYFVIRLDIKESIHSIDAFRKKLEKEIDQIGVKSKQITLQYEGCIDGSLTLDEKNRIANFLVDELEGEIALKHEEDDIYTVYAYTGLINEYIVSMGSKINIQIAITYDEQENKTKVYLATPILNSSW